jgi:hypothetical protein
VTQIIDRYSYAGHPEGERFLFGFFGLAALGFLLFIGSRLTTTAIVIYVLVAASLIGSRWFFMLRERSEVTLDEAGIERGDDGSPPWLRIPWAAIDHVETRPFTAASTPGVFYSYMFYPKPGANVSRFSKRVKIAGAMVRHEAFRNTLVVCLRERQIPIVELDG